MIEKQKPTEFIEKEIPQQGTRSITNMFAEQRIVEMFSFQRNMNKNEKDFF